MRRLITLCAVLTLIAAACGGEGASSTSTTPVAATSSTTRAPATTTTTTEPPGIAVTSDDGRVTVDISAEALAADPGIAITRLSPEEEPEDLAALGLNPWVYRLEPEKLTFEAPVKITMEIPFDEYFKVDGFDGATPLTTLVTTTLDGSGWELLDELKITREGDSVLVSGMTDHFSRLAALPEQVYIEARIAELTPQRLARFGIEFTWSNGVPLVSPEITSASFLPESGGDALPIDTDGDVQKILCPPTLTSFLGDLEFEMVLRATEDTSGNTGLTSAPRLLGSDTQAAVIVNQGIKLVCRPTISVDGSIELTVSIDHPAGEQIVPGGDFLGGASAYFGVLGGLFPGLLAGIIEDTDGDGLIGPNDLMFPPQPTTVTGSTTEFVLPLYNYGNYFFYFIEGEGIVVPPITSTVSVRDGATTLLGGLVAEERTSVPYLGDIPFIGQVFSSETTTRETTELLIFLTPQIIRQN